MKTGSLSLILLCGLQSGLGPGPLAAEPADAQKSAVPVYTVPAPGRAAPADVETNTSKVKQMLKAISLSPGLDEILKLHKAGVDDSVLLSFIQNSSVAYRPSAQEILELRENGISTPVITALLQHGGELRQRDAEAAAQSQPPAPAPAVSTPPAVPSPTPVQPAAYYAAPTVYPVSSPTVVYAPYPVYSYPYGGCYYPRYYTGLGFYGGFYPSISLGLRFGGGHLSGHFGGYHGGFHHR